jgi:hypothetical protein
MPAGSFLSPGPLQANSPLSPASQSQKLRTKTENGNTKEKKRGEEQLLRRNMASVRPSVEGRKY